MIYDKDIEKTQRIIRGFNLREQKVLKKIINDLVFIKNTYSSIRSQVVLINLILMAIDKSKSTEDFSWLYPIIQSLNSSVSIDIVKLLQTEVRDDDISIYRTLDDINSNSNLFLNFLNQKYEYNMTMCHFKVLLNKLEKEVKSLEKMHSNYLKKYRNKKIAHLTREILTDQEMKDMMLQQKDIYLKFTEIFKTSLGIGVKLPIVTEPMISNANKILIKNCKIFLKKTKLYKYIRKHLNEQLFLNLGIQRNMHYSIVTENGIISS